VSKFLILLVLGLVTRFAYIWHPNEIMDDELHFGRYAAVAYNTGEYFFDIHPPLGKLLIALGGYLGGYNSDFAFNYNLEPYLDSSNYIVLRFLPTLIGALHPIVTFLFVRALRGRVLAALFAALVVVFDNALIVRSSFMNLDSMLIFLGFLGLTLFFWY
jgi:dolichyl-phosphate-mannose-protein mannosyltransferase